MPPCLLSLDHLHVAVMLNSAFQQCSSLSHLRTTFWLIPLLCQPHSMFVFVVFLFLTVNISISQRLTTETGDVDLSSLQERVGGPHHARCFNGTLEAKTLTLSTSEKWITMQKITRVFERCKCAGCNTPDKFRSINAAAECMK
ncbi:hypothetical protein PROFUN_06034 [Planoprotostelium fungivorum]|uniref:Uncharacterized protein n=1 Tax=Planoprotostelium fungivorum TaxID=1890364 RepID=A0A2P6NPN9_9EUKA|nr:hypothetical protein PROFUN_06034 [Planoprotostelium fungivorum]